MTTSRKSTGRPSTFAPAFAAPSAIPFISRRYSSSYLRRKTASAKNRISAHAPGPSFGFSWMPSFLTYSAISSATSVPYWTPRAYGSPSTWT